MVSPDAPLTLFDPDLEPLEGPGGRPFTPEQALAVRRRAGSLLLEANAGSGKTSVLAERFVRSVLEDGVAPAQILAITFTDKAAGELRERVRKRFLELGERERARETEAAFISTIHGFCARVLRSRALSAGLDPSFTVLDEARARGLRDQALTSALEHFVAAGGEPAVDFLAAYTVDGAGEMVRTAHDVLRSRGHEVVLPPVAPAPRPSRALRDDLVAAARAAADALGGASGVSVEAALSAYGRCGDLIGALTDGPEGLPSAGALGALQIGRRTNAMACAACEAYDEALAAYAAGCEHHRATALWPHADALLRAYAQAYADAKRAAGAVDFDDLEVHTRDLLVRDRGVRENLARRFTAIMVDEFQDTNPLQLEILEAIERDNLFAVGDELQSIYGFRHADVKVFRARRARLDPAGAVLRLAANFRSRAAILDTLNAAFADVFPRGFVPLRAGGEAGLVPEHADPLVELLVTDAPAWDAAVADGELNLGATLPPVQPWRQAEARMVAQRISDLIDAGEAEAKDVVVLVRAGGSIPVFERALLDQGLQTYAAGGRGYWSRQQVQDLVAWIRALANPRDEEALLHALASPLVGVSSDALALVAMEAQASGRDPWWVLREPGAELSGRLPDAERARVLGFAADFAQERAQAARMPLDQVVLRAATRTGYDLHVLRLPGGTRRLANIHKLARLAAQFEASGGRDLRGFADAAAADTEAEARESDAPVEIGDLDVVRLMTIHAAKGLEFGVVCVADLGRQGQVDRPRLIVDGDRAGLRVASLEPGTSVPALDYRELSDLADVAAEEEERRVMYVAMTRAKDRLILSGAANPARWPGERPGAPPLAWVGPAFAGGALGEALAPGAPARQDIVRKAGVFTGAVRLVRNAPETVGEALREASLAPDPDAPVAQAPGGPAPLPAPPADEPQAAPSAGASTLSYSALADYAACGYRFYLQRILRLPPEEDRAGAGAATAPVGLDARERGNVVHALLEELDFATPGPPSDSEIARAAAPFGARLGGDDAADVRALIDGFARSPLRARIAQAVEAGGELQREHGFAFALAGAATPLINGVIDVRVRERGADGAPSALVVDYKTDRVGPDADLAAHVGRAYGVQRRIYALAELRTGVARVEVVHVFLQRPDAPVVAVFTAQDIPVLEGELQGVAAGVAAGAFAVAPDPHRALCLTCPGRRTLCSWPQEMTLREAPGDPPVGPIDAVGAAADQDSMV
jgi:ATP-dependent helicase/nuclease subunit A